jgi:hypothetical protein
MKNAQLPLMAELSVADTTHSTTDKFTGTDNPRHLRVIHALMVRSRPREEIDRVAGCSNGPDLIASLRRVGIEIPCARVRAFDRDGLPVNRGVYFLSSSDRRTVSRWIRERLKECA